MSKLRDSFQPASFSKLVLTGFSLVALPLIVALVHAQVSVERLESRGKKALYVATAATQMSRALLEQILDLERKARQFNVLEDDQSLQAYLDKHEVFRKTARDLAGLPIDEEQRRQIQVLEQGVGLVSGALRDSTLSKEGLKEAVERFQHLSELAKGILTQTNEMVFRERDALQLTAERTKGVLVWEALGLIPVTVLFAVLFAILISRPVRQIHRAINRLGEGDLTSGIAVRGPKDVEFLGERLDWLRRRLAETEESKKKFLAHASHDLKTPLTAIREASDLLLEGAAGKLNGDQEEVAQILRQNSVRLQRSVQDLLDFSVEGAKGAQPKAGRISLPKLLQDVVFDHKPTISKKEIALETRVSDVAVMGNGEQLRVILDNLISNAVKFTPPRGKILVAIARVSGRAIIEVADSGPGIDPADKARVFDAFYQGRTRSQGQGFIKGSGLGLSIAMEYASLHGGKIEIIDSRRGAHFRVSLASIEAGALV